MILLARKFMLWRKKRNTVVYSVTGTWWDTLDKASKTKNVGLPCCPKCDSLLFETGKKAWNKSVAEYNMMHPGYRDFTKWLRGKCYASYSEAVSFYRKEVDPNFQMR